MTKSHKIGPLRVRPHKRNGVATGKWFVDIPASVTGSGRRKRRLFDNRKQAIVVARELWRRLGHFGSGPVNQSQSSGLTFAEATLRWADEERDRVETLKKRASTLEADEHRLKALKAFLGAYDLSAISRKTLIEYQKWRLNEGRKPRTINSELGTFGLVIKWAFVNQYLDDVPKVERIPVVRHTLVVPTQEEVVRVIAALPAKLRPLLWLIAETGCRKGEAFNLTWDCVDEVNGFVEIRSNLGWTPKTQSSEREIPLSPGLVSAIRELPKVGPFVFPGLVPGKPMDNMRKALRTAVEQAGIRRHGRPVNLTLHSFRKAYATWQARRGIDENVLQSLLGHAPGSRVTRQYYVQAQQEDRLAAVIALPIGERARNKVPEILAKSGNKPKS